MCVSTVLRTKCFGNRHKLAEETRINLLSALIHCAQSPPLDYIGKAKRIIQLLTHYICTHKSFRHHFKAFLTHGGLRGTAHTWPAEIKALHARDAPDILLRLF